MQPLLRHEIQSARRARVLNDSLMQELERVARAEEDVVDKQKRLVRYVARACGFGDNVAEGGELFDPVHGLRGSSEIGRAHV